MLSIFDQAHGTASALKLLLDALFSLSRQWTLRPEFWQDLSPAASPQPTSDGIPSFYTISPFRPRSAAVINGLVLSLAVFCMTCFAIRYSWIHVLHVRIPEVQFERPSWIPPKGAISGTSPTLQKTPISPPEKRTPPADSATSALSQVPPAVAVPQRRTARAATHPDTARPQYKPQVSNQQARTTSAAELPLKSYEGTYVVDSPANLRIVITVEDENLMMSMSGQERLTLAPMSEAKFAVQGIENCWIEFSPGRGTMGDESAPQLQLSCNGQRYTALRQP
jgi:hypothetical protein